MSRPPLWACLVGVVLCLAVLVTVDTSMLTGDAVAELETTTRSGRYTITRTKYGHVRVYDEDPSALPFGNVVVLMSGHMRTYRSTLASINTRLLAPNRAPIIIASYPTDGFKVFRQFNMSGNSASVDYGLVEGALAPYLRATHIVTSTASVMRTLVNKNVSYIYFNALLQFFIMELCMNTTDVFFLQRNHHHRFEVFVRIRPDMYVMGKEVRYLPGRQVYTCGEMEYETLWDPSNHEVLVSPHHPIFLWKEPYSDHTISLGPRLAAQFFRLYSHVLRDFPRGVDNPYLFYNATSKMVAEWAWRYYLSELKVALGHIHRVPGWHLVLRNQSNFFSSGSKKTSRNEMRVFGTTTWEGMPCPAFNGTLTNVKRHETNSRTIIAVLPPKMRRGTMRVKAKGVVGRKVDVNRRQSIQHGAHAAHRLTVQMAPQWYSGRFCAVCRGVLGVAPIAFCAPCSFAMCQKCYLIREVAIVPGPLHIVLKDPSSAVPVRTRPTATSHVLCMMYPHAVYTVVSRASCTSTGTVYGRLDYGGWIELNNDRVVALADSGVHPHVASAVVGCPDTDLSLAALLAIVTRPESCDLERDFATAIFEALIESGGEDSVLLDLVAYLATELDRPPEDNEIQQTSAHFHADESLKARYGACETPVLLRHGLSLGLWLRSLCVLTNVVQPPDRAYLLDSVDRPRLVATVISIASHVSRWALASALQHTAEGDQVMYFALNSTAHATSSQREQTLLSFAMAVLHSAVWLLIRLAPDVSLDAVASAFNPWFQFMQRSGYPSTGVAATVLECYAVLARDCCRTPEDLRRYQALFLSQDVLEVVLKVLPMFPKAACDMLDVVLVGGDSLPIANMLPIVARHVSRVLNEIITTRNTVHANAIEVLRVLTTMCTNKSVCGPVKTALESNVCTVQTCGAEHALQPAVLHNGRTYCAHCVRSGHVLGADPTILTHLLCVCHCSCCVSTIPSPPPPDTITGILWQHSCATSLQGDIYHLVHLDHFLYYAQDPAMALFLLAVCTANHLATDHLLFAGVIASLLRHLLPLSAEDLLCDPLHTPAVELFIYLALWDVEGESVAALLAGIAGHDLHSVVAPRLITSRLLIDTVDPLLLSPVVRPALPDDVMITPPHTDPHTTVVREDVLIGVKIPRLAWSEDRESPLRDST